MKLTNHEWLRAGGWLGLLTIGLGLMSVTLGSTAKAQAFSTTTIQGTVYLANGQPGSGTVVVSWPSFTTASGQLVAADSTTIAIAPDGFISVNLAPNLGSTPAGQYYTAVYYMSDGSTSTEYWVVPAAAQATLGQIQAQIMPAAQAVQAASKAYVDEAIAELSGSLLTASGGTLSGPLTLCCDPTQPLQAADKHYVDETFALAVPLAGGSMTGALTTPAMNGVESPAVGSSQTTLQSAINAAGTNGAVEIPPTYAGTDGFTNPNGVYVSDLRQGSSQQYERSVKEFGAVCDGITDDTSALQAALNYAQAHGVALSIPQGTCKTHTLNWHGESIGGMGKQVSALMGFPGQDVLLTATDSTSILSYTRIHDLTIYVDQSQDISCSAAKGLAPAGSCAQNRPMESNSIFSPGGNGLTGTQGTGTAWAVGNCAIAMPASTGAGGNGLKVAEIENVEIAATGVDPMAGQYAGAQSTHTCGMYLAQWPRWSDFRNIDIRGLNTGIAIPALPGTAPAGLIADSNRWQNITIQATHGFTAAAGSNDVLDNVVSMVGNSAATGEPPTGVVLDLAGTQQGWTVRNSVVMPVWDAVQPTLTISASGGAVTAVAVGTQAGLGFDPYGAQVPLTFSGSCTAQALGNVNSGGAIGSVTVTSGGVGCSNTTTANVNVAGTWDTDAPVNLISGQSMSFYGGNLLKGNGGYTVWNATNSMSYGTQLDGGGGRLPSGGSYAALVANSSLGSASQVDQFPGVDFGAKLQSCLNTLSSSYGGTCDARNFTGNQSMGSNLTIATANATVQLPCATISTSNQILIAAGIRNVSLRGCALRGASTASGSQGGTVFMYSGTGAMVRVGDPTYAADTIGFHLDNVVINTTSSMSATAQGLAAYRTQEMDLESLYLLGNSNQTGMTLDGTGNYTGGTFLDNEFNGFQIAVNGIGHQISNPATTDWVNASTFVRLHIDCPTSGGIPISGSYGINLQQGDGNTFTGGDVEGCSTALHLGANAQNNTIVGLRNENSTNQIVADAGSSYNSWMSGGTIFTGALTDNGTRNSFLDTFHRSFNGLNGDWYGSQKDATVTNHYRLGIGTGNERGLLDRYQTDYGYRWTTGLSDASAGEQFYQILDELNNVYRLSIGQYNNGQSSTNNQTVINSAGTGAVVLNGSNNSGTGGVVIGSGGASETTVATINNGGNAQFNGTLQVGGASTFAGTTTVENQADTEIDATLWSGLTTSQKESFSYKDWNGNSQWYMVKDASNNWALNSATGGLDSFKAYQSTNSGDTYVNTSNSTGAVRINYETGSGSQFKVYGGNSSSLYAAFTGVNSIQFPGLAASSGHNCLQVDNSGYITNTGSTCGSGSGSGTVNSGTSGQIAYYNTAGTAVSGISTVPITAGGTGSSTASGALANLLPGVASNGSNGVIVTGNSQLNGTLQVAGTTTFGGTTTVENLANAEIDSTLWAGSTASQKESFTYKDWNGNNQWYMIKDTSNNWALNSATGGLDSFKAYQSSNSGDTYINASNASGVVRVNYETGAGSAFNIYGGGSSSLYASFTGTTSIKFPGLAASSGHNCLQIDNSGYITNTGASCGSGNTNGTVNSGTSGQIAFYSGTGTALSGTNTVSISAGGTGASTASGALANLGGAALSGSTFTGPVNIASTLSVANNTSIGPRYDVTNSTFGAKGDGTTDDTLAIQAAFNACWNNGLSPHGGIIEFPGNHNFVVSSTINAYDGCQIEGTIGNGGGGFSPPQILWNGSTPGAVYSITSVTIAVNSTPVYAPSSPAPYSQPYIATFTANNSLTAGQWVDIEGLSTTGGMQLNRGILQVASATASGFTAVVPYGVTTGSFTDTGTATASNVMIAFDADARYEQAVSSIVLGNKSETQANTFQVGFYFGSRVDTGTRIWHGEVEDATEYSYYFSDGGINIDFDKGWRSDSAGIAAIYWRVGGSDSFGIANGTVDNNRGAFGSASSGAAVILDNQTTCGIVNFSSRNIKVEVNTTITPGLGVFTLYDCPSASNGEQFFLSFDTTWVAPASGSTAGFNFPSIVMSPANDKALVLSATNSGFGSGSGANTTAAFVGIPGLLRGNILGSSGYSPMLTYSPSIGSSGINPGSLASPTQVFGDLNISQLWQYGIHASSLLYSDTAFAALPNATTLYTGQIIAPPSYWNGGNGKRYALDVVYQAGTTGTPNGGATTCSGSSGTSVLTCTSATDLSAGQNITIGSDTYKTINNVDATQPRAVLVNLTNNLSVTHTSQTLAFAPPLLASEIQLPTKSSGTPTALAWSQGDMEENSGAAANGVAAWVNVAAGTPGTWAGIPLGNSNGQISSSQISSGSLQGSDAKVLTAGTVTGTAVPLCTDANGGATTSGCPNVTGIVTVANGGTGASSATVALTNLGAVGTSTTVNGHALSSNVTVSASDLTTGTLPHAQLPALVSADIPNNSANTSGTAANVTGTVAVTNGGTGATSASAALSSLGAVGTSTTVNGHALSSNVTVSASDLTTGTLPHAQLPALASTDIPNNAANTTGTAAGFTGSLSGDVSGSQTATTVSKINGGSIPASSNALSTNSSSQLVASTSHNLSVPANCAAASGSGTAYTCSTSPTFTPSAGDHIQFKADVANTGSSTLAVNGATAATIKKWGGSGNLIANDLLLGHWISATFDGSYWQLEGQLGNANATELNGTAITGLSGSGSVLALTSSPVFTTPTLGVASATSLTTLASSTFGGNANTFNNAAAAENDVIVQAGSGAAQTAAYQLNTYAGSAAWKLRMDSSNYLRLNDVANSLDREVFYQNGQTMINSGAGANAVVINNVSGSGTGGLVVYEGGSNSSTIAANLSGSGAATFAGTVTAPSFTGALTGNASTATTAANLSGTPALPNGSTATTQAANDNSTKLATTAYVQNQTRNVNTPDWLQYEGTGTDGSYEFSSTGSCSTSPTHCVINCTSASPCNASGYGDMYTSGFQVDSGAVIYGSVTGTSADLTVHSNNACNIYGTILVNGAHSAWPNTNKGYGGGSSGGSGGGSSAGAAGIQSYFTPVISNGLLFYNGGTAGATSGGNG
ncbi:MAG: hypothetical protein WAN35_06100, partial [Terracidiphilus sp.]